MVAELVLQSWLSAVAGLVVAVTTTILTEYRENHRWLRTKVHQPLYGELTAVISGDLPEGERGYESLWANLDYYKTYRVDADLSEALDQYASTLTEISAVEREADVDAFVDALPADICDADEGTARLPSGRTIDMRTWLRHNLLVLAADPRYRDEAYGVEPTELEPLWAEVDGIDPVDEDVELGDVLRATSMEFNWGYEAFYDHWDDGWADTLLEALLEVSETSGETLQEAITLRRDAAAQATAIKAMIEARADRSVLTALWSSIRPTED